MKKTVALITISLFGTISIILYALLQAFWHGEDKLTQGSTATSFVKEISCQILSSSPNPFQNNNKSASKMQTLSWEPLRQVGMGTSFKTCGSQNLGVDEQLFNQFNQPGDKEALLKAIAHSLRYLVSNEAAKDYQGYSVPEMTREHVFRSLVRFRELVISSRSATELEAAVKREFVFYQSVGKDRRGEVLFTAYYEPIYAASRVLTPEYRYPIYRRPPNLESWPKPHPTRKQLEGIDGLQGSKGKLRGLELFWLRNRLDPYLAQIQGSALLQLTDGTQTSVGYADNTAYDYTSVGAELARDGKLPLEGMTMPIILKYFSEHPLELKKYLPRDQSFVFFQENQGGKAMGSINVPITASRSIATDKSLMPPGALALIHAPFPFKNGKDQLEHLTVSRYVLDQDTGGAIKGAGRVDYFLGTGQEAGERAGVTVSNGQLYYLLLKR
ncbi:MAG: MltA domain-containing protein [Potamolinea sp.]